MLLYQIKQWKISNISISISNQEGIEFLNTLPDNSVDLILTDPPYIISKETGMNKFVKEVAAIDASGKKKQKNGYNLNPKKVIQTINIVKV